MTDGPCGSELWWGKEDTWLHLEFKLQQLVNVGAPQTTDKSLVKQADSQTFTAVAIVEITPWELNIYKYYMC